ncbi:hypothetical protein E2562_033476 [Oryza meyeriana var. granulata]|uniref:Uncharacterized protein n=1 Tax=Oryza meyeriana var. granulata TaxID=110450 RepID=A0A6G1F0W4_9ORYZ|nr:hypothetical protein E2562_033476 [Oryza meyeriana var. granulata]
MKATVEVAVVAAEDSMVGVMPAVPMTNKALTVVGLGAAASAVAEVGGTEDDKDGAGGPEYGSQ